MKERSLRDWGFLGGRPGRGIARSLVGSFWCGFNIVMIVVVGSEGWGMSLKASKDFLGSR